ncbi:hypothetical protein FNH22_27240 [Fulvivirga sp. M361]|uniref:hypothetical protein n=1 Tax=Fulvivirga sp. M361 TaxID=2594266 RepID=UPI00117A65B9|nr:hypothetical protein [Fulvivirga sp. M361]TRX49324.1 hypothetical protein FNH22_27240 [Fulvivirga sp. M361]
MQKLFFVLLLLWSCSSEVRNANDQPQIMPADPGVIVNRSARDFRLKFKRDSFRLLTLTRSQDSNTYQFMKYTFPSDSMVRLADEMTFIHNLWNVAEDSIDIHLTSLSAGYPLRYTDILKNQIEAFSESKEWQKFVSENEREPDYAMISQIMQEQHVYAPLESLLTDKGYALVGISIEKVGRVMPEQLKALGYQGDEKIPVPYMVWLSVAKR